MSAPASTGPPAATSHSGRNALVAIIIVLVVVVILFAVPLPHPYSASFTSSSLVPGTVTENFPTGSTVRGSWSTASGGSVAFAIVSHNGNTVYTATGSSGSYSFTASNPPYKFGADSFSTQNVSMSGTYSSTIL